MASRIEDPNGERVYGVKYKFLNVPDVAASPMTSSHRLKPGLILQPRDREFLRQLAEHRFMKSEHLHALTEPAVSRRVIQTRLKKLFSHGYLKRLYVPVVLDGTHARLAHCRQPIYTLTTRGIRLLEEQGPGSTRGLTWVAERPSVQFLAHHLVVTECLVALKVASRHHPAVTLVSGHAESRLRVQLHAYRRLHQLPRAIVPDGVFTLFYESTQETLTLYLEVVRADVRGGNARLIEKFRHYSELHRQGFFRQVYGHDRIRAVIFATTSSVRAANLATLAKQLAHGRQMFWFGNYQEKTMDGRFVSFFTSEKMLTLPWKTPDGEVVSLLQPNPPPARAGEPA